MFGSFIDWINRAANKPTAHKATGEGGHDVPFDLTKHAPQFTAKDHEAARAQGYRDALDKFLWEMGGKLADEGARKRKLQSKAQMRADLEGEGLSTEELGGLSEEAARLPRYPHYEPKPEVHAPKDPYMRNAQVQGMVNRLIQLDERFRDHGVSLFDEEADVSPELREKYRWAQMERQRVAKRLVAFGEDPSEIEEGIQSGDLQRNMEIPARENVAVKQGAFLPHAAAKAGYQVLEGNGKGMPDGLNVSVGAEWSIYAGGRRHADVAAAKAQVRSLELQRADVDKLVELDVRQAHARVNEAIARIRKDKAARALGEEGMQLAELRFQQGAGIQADTLDAELALSTAETALVQSLRGYAAALAGLDKAVGRPPLGAEGAVGPEPPKPAQPKK